MLSKEEYYFPICLLLNILAMLLLMQSSMSLPSYTAGLLSTENHMSFSPEQVPSLGNFPAQVLDFALLLLDFHYVLVNPFLYLHRSFQKDCHTLNCTDSTPRSVPWQMVKSCHYTEWQQNIACACTQGYYHTAVTVTKVSHLVTIFFSCVPLIRVEWMFWCCECSTSIRRDSAQMAFCF